MGYDRVDCRLAIFEHVYDFSFMLSHEDLENIAVPVSMMVFKCHS